MQLNSRRPESHPLVYFKWIARLVGSPLSLQSRALNVSQASLTLQLTEWFARTVPRATCTQQELQFTDLATRWRSVIQAKAPQSIIFVQCACIYMLIDVLNSVIMKYFLPYHQKASLVGLTKFSMNTSLNIFICSLFLIIYYLFIYLYSPFSVCRHQH